ncbi:MAG TPA: hypothetical protein VMW49_06035 [Candidatus Dormibacteraeota bacterium]|nr:hypothetical protein [Candidatus Dormibacteraeota bacterium]
MSERGLGIAEALSLPAPATRTPVDILRHAIGYLDSGLAPFGEHPTWALYRAIVRAQAKGTGRGEAAHGAVRAVMADRHPDYWPTTGCLVRLVAEWGPAALRGVLVAALDRLAAEPAP